MEAFAEADGTETRLEPVQHAAFASRHPPSVEQTKAHIEALGVDASVLAKL